MGFTKGTIKAISVSAKRGMKKTNVPQAELKAGFGIIGDVHAGSPLRQVSLLSFESIQMAAGDVTISPGDFAENVTTQGLNLGVLHVGSRIRLGAAVEIEITQIGKRCHGRCEIYKQLGDCVMPREGVFAEVRKSGIIKVGDVMEVVGDASSHTDNQR